MVAVLNLNLSLNVLMVDWPKIRLLPAIQSAVMRTGKVSLAQKKQSGRYGYFWLYLAIFGVLIIRQIGKSTCRYD